MTLEKTDGRIILPFSLHAKRHSLSEFDPCLLVFSINPRNLVTSASIIRKKSSIDTIDSRLSRSHGHYSIDGKSGYTFDSIHANINLSDLGTGLTQTSLMLLYVARNGVQQLIPVFPGFTVEMGEIVFTPHLTPHQYIWLQVYGRSLLRKC